jgi:sulfatase maturation enzyme AslB (radical SAM superfamily)
MKGLENFSSMVASMASEAGVTAFAQSAKIRSLFKKRAERAAYEYIIEENEDRRPITVQKEKMRIMLNLSETAFKRVEEGLYSKSVIKHGIDIFVSEVLFSPKGKSKKVIDAFVAKYGRRPPGFLVIGPTRKCNLRCKGCYASAHSRTAATIPFSILDRIITEKTELWGSHYATWVGGEPTVYRSEGKDIFDISERHRDNMFLMYTNGGTH